MSEIAFSLFTIAFPQEKVQNLNFGDGRDLFHGYLQSLFHQVLFSPEIP